MCPDIHTSNNTNSPHSPKPNYSVGDKVWYYRPARKKGICPKLQSFWEGHFTVVKKINPVLYLIKSSRGSQKMVVNVEKMKLDISRSEPLDISPDFFGENPKSSDNTALRPTNVLPCNQMPQSSSKQRMLRKPHSYGTCQWAKRPTRILITSNKLVNITLQMKSKQKVVKVKTVILASY